MVEEFARMLMVLMTGCAFYFCSEGVQRTIKRSATATITKAKIPHSAAAIVANRRRFMIPSPPKAPTALIFQIKK